MKSLSNLKFFHENTVFKRLGLGIFASIGLLLIAFPASAHHAMGGKVPADFFQGFMSGIAHPLIGFDHFAFIFSVGLLAAIQRRGIFIPIAFVLSSMLGAGAHLATLNLLDLSENSQPNHSKPLQLFMEILRSA